MTTIPAVILIGLLTITSLPLSQLARVKSNKGPSPAVAKQIISGSEKFSLEIFKRVSESALPDHDFIFSPCSIWSLLILLTEGAAKNTETELQSVLHLQNDVKYMRKGYKYIQSAFKVNESTIELAISQALITDKNRRVKRHYEDILTRKYKVAALSVNFANTETASNSINEYFQTETGGKLGKIVTPEDFKNARMILFSAIYFKSQWTFPFNVSQTTKQPFYDESGKSLGEVNMMYQKGAFAYNWLDSLDAHALELPYGRENQLSMILLLPKSGVSVQTVIGKIQTVGIRQIEAELLQAKTDYEDEDMEMFLPRFSISTDIILNNVLQDMGLVDIFDKFKSNLSKISERLYLSKIAHKAQIEVNEEGSSASAVTVAVIANRSPISRFHANRPFAYLIVEKSTHALLFCGQVKNPTKTK